MLFRRAQSNNESAIEVPKELQHLTGWFKVADIISWFLMALSVAKLILGDWVPIFFSDKVVTTGIGVFAVLIFVSVRYWRTQSPLTLYAARLVRDTKILTTAQRDGVAQHLERIDWRRRYFTLPFVIGGFVLFGIMAYEPVCRWSTTDIPKAVTIKQGEYYAPSKDDNFLVNAPFFEAVNSTLVREGKAEQSRFRVITFATNPFTHPTLDFNLKFESEKSRFELNGYGFRLRRDFTVLMYEPLKIINAPEGKIEFYIPASEKGDWIFCIMRMTLKTEGPFPDNVASVIVSTPSKPNKENK